MKKVYKNIKDSRRIFKDMGMNKWLEVGILMIRKGDRIRIYSEAGRPLELGGEETLIALSDAYKIEGVWAVDI